MVSVNKLPLTWPTIMSDATIARMEHGKYVGVRGESRRHGVCTLRKKGPFMTYVCYRREYVGEICLAIHHMSTIGFQGFQVLRVSESKIFLGAPASPTSDACLTGVTAA